MSKTWAILKWVGVAVVLLGVVGVGAGLFVWPAVQEQIKKAKEGARGELVRLEAVKSGELVRTVSAPGQVDAVNKVSVSARFSAQIIELPFQEGDPVKKDDLVVRLDNRQLLAQLSSAEASLTQEQARLAGAQASYTNSVLEWERQQSLFKSNDAAKQALENAEADRLRAESSLRAAEASIMIAQANIERVKEDLRYTEIISPINGMVTRLAAKVGEVVVTGTMNNPGTVIMEIADLTEMIVKTEVDEADIADVRLGQSARVRLNAFQDEVFQGRVSKIALQKSKARDQSDVFIVEVLLDLKGRTLYSGLTANVEIEVETVQGVLLAPSQSVLDVRVDELPRDVVRDNPSVDQNKTFTRVVYRVVDGQAKATPVKTGPSDLRTTAILSGVEAGSKVIIGPYKALTAMKDGAKVRDEEDDKKEKEAKEAAEAEAKKKKDAEKAAAQKPAQASASSSATGAAPGTVG